MEKNLNSGSIKIDIVEKEKCVIVSQSFFDVEGKFKSKTCTVTCDGGKSYSWTCSEDKDCEGDCSDPENPKGRCV